MRTTDWVGIVALCLVPIAFPAMWAFCRWRYPPIEIKESGPMEWSEDGPVEWNEE